ncbi:MAG: MBL fold metallo-hydrolase [Candidatus Phosphoribacter sp.]
MSLPPVPPVWGSGQVTARAHCVLAPNPGVMTLDGTNTWVLREPGAHESVVVDPGPLDESHLRAVLDVVERDGGRVGLIVLTHDHADHAEAAVRFAQLSGARCRAVRAGGFGHDDLGDGDLLQVGGLELLVISTPGHTADSVSLVLTAECAVLTGDTVLGRGTSVVAWPDGELAAYLASLERLEALVGTGAVAQILPGHGPHLPDAAAVVRYYLTHRAERLEQVRVAVAQGARTPREVVEIVYADVPREVWGAAEWSVRAQLAYLAERA